MLRDVACEVNSGEVLAVLCLSVAGKTTQLRLLSFHSCGAEAFGAVTGLHSIHVHAALRVCDDTHTGRS